MKLTLKRIALRETYTIGKLFIDGIFFSNTLEDTVRDLDKDGVCENKIWGETAIPYGTYKVCLTMSPKFHQLLPRLMNVKGFEGILMHAGNTSLDTHGCILLGMNTEVGKVTNSVKTFAKFMSTIGKEKDITITVE